MASVSPQPSSRGISQHTHNQNATGSVATDSDTTAKFTPLTAVRQVTIEEAFKASKTYDTSCLKRFIKQQLQLSARSHLARFENEEHPESHYYHAVLTSAREREAFVQKLAKRDVAGILSTPLSDFSDRERKGAAHRSFADDGDTKRSTLLHWACYSGCLEFVELLVAFGANVNAAETDGKTPLHWAAFEGQEDICRFLLSMSTQGRARAARGDDGDEVGTPKSEQIVDCLALAEDNDQHRILTPCHLAVINHHMAVAQLFPNYFDVINSNADNSSAPVEILVGSADEVPVVFDVETNQRGNSSGSQPHEHVVSAPLPPPPPQPPAASVVYLTHPRPVTHEMGVLTSPASSRSRSASSSSSSSSSSGEEARRRRRRRRKEREAEERRRRRRERRKEKEETLRQLILAINAATLAKEQIQQQKEVLLHQQELEYEALLMKNGSRRGEGADGRERGEGEYRQGPPMTIRWGHHEEANEARESEKIVVFHENRASLPHSSAFSSRSGYAAIGQHASRSPPPVAINGPSSSSAVGTLSSTPLRYGGEQRFRNDSGGWHTAPAMNSIHSPSSPILQQNRDVQEKGAHEGSSINFDSTSEKVKGHMDGRGQSFLGNTEGFGGGSDREPEVQGGEERTAGEEDWYQRPADKRDHSLLSTLSTASTSSRPTPSWSHFYDRQHLAQQRDEVGDERMSRGEGGGRTYSSPRRFANGEGGRGGGNLRGGEGARAYPRNEEYRPLGYFLRQPQRATSPSYDGAGRPPWRPPSKVSINADVRAVVHGPLVTETQIALSQARSREAAATGKQYGRTLNMNHNFGHED